MEFLGQDKPVNKIQPLVSVCVQTYQHNNYIRNCLDGILNQQTTFPVELILGEDGSTDGTREICREYAIKHQDIIRCFMRSREDVIYINRSPTGRFNFIENISAARGKYIALCEGDDYWTDQYKLQKQVEYLDNRPECSMCFHDVDVLYKNDKATRAFSAVERKKKYDLGTFIDLINSHCIQTSSIIFRSCYKDDMDSKFIQKSSIGDWALYVSLAEHGFLGYINEKMITYRVHDNGIWSSLDKLRQGLVRIDFYNQANKHLNYKYNTIILRKISYQYFKIAEGYMDQEKRADTLKYLWKSIKSSPVNPTIPYYDFCGTALRALTPKLYEISKKIKKRLI